MSLYSHTPCVRSNARVPNQLLLTDSQHLDPARLAALIDGQLSDVEAASVRAQLAIADDDALSAFADAIAISGALAEGSAPLRGGRGIVVPILSARKRRRWIMPSLATAAAAAAITFIAVRSGQSPSDVYRPFVLAAALPGTVGLQDAPVWGVTRGSADGVSARARAVRVGALLTDLEFSALRGDNVGPHASALATLLEDVPGSTSSIIALRQYAAARGSGRSAHDRRVLGQGAMHWVDVSLANAGAYLEAARLATASGDTSFIDRFPASDVTSLARGELLDSGSRAALRRLVGVMETRPRDVTAIHAAVEALLRLLTQ